MHHFSVEKPRISVEITEISPGIHRNFVFEFKSPFRLEIAKSAEISAEIPFPVIGGILRKNGKVNPGDGYVGYQQDSTCTFHFIHSSISA